jgi:hypothetical protein
MVDITMMKAVAFAFVFVPAVSSYLNERQRAYTLCKHNPYTIFQNYGYWVFPLDCFHKDTKLSHHTFAYSYL